MSKHKKETTNPKDACACCGNDLYCEDNIYAETKRMMDGLLKSMDPKHVGRPAFLMVLGDNGTDVVASPMFGGGSDILAEMLEEVVGGLKAQPWKGNSDE
jgi:hypothetical protein